ncbi:AMP-binding protein [Pseudomonadota bacterium]
MLHTLSDLLALSKDADVGARPFIVQRNDSLSYEAFHMKVERLRSWLLMQPELSKGDRIAVFLPKCWQEVVAFFAITTAGFVFVSINQKLKSHQVRHVVLDSGCAHMITTGALLDDVSEVYGELGLKTIIRVDEPIQTDMACETAMEISLESILSGGHAHLPAPMLLSEDIASLLYTSGSTGSPKGVVLSHGNMVDGAQIVSGYLGVQEHDRIASILPFSFDYGLSQLLISAFKRCTLVLVDYLFPKDLVRAVETHGITVLPLVPHLWVHALTYLGKKNRTLPGVRIMTNTGGALAAKYVEVAQAAFPEGNLFLMYGLTEAFRSTYLPIEELQRRPGSIGKAIPGVEIYVINEQGDECGPNEVGELVHRGALVSKGYWRDAQRTAERFRPSPRQLAGQVIEDLAVYSGDFVRKDDDGFLFFVGRKDNIVKSQGFRINTLEVEHVIRSIPSILDCVVVAVPSDMSGSELVAYIQSHDAPDDQKPALIAHLEAELPYYMIPRAMNFTKDFPLTVSGKVDRQLLLTQAIEQRTP